MYMRKKAIWRYLQVHLPDNVTFKMDIEERKIVISW